MGKVISGFPNGWAGAISRAVDDIVEAYANVSGTAIPFGSPVFQDSERTGVTGIQAGAGTETFLGFAVRSPAKTPNVYGTEDENSRGAYPIDFIPNTSERRRQRHPARQAGVHQPGHRQGRFRVLLQHAHDPGLPLPHRPGRQRHGRGRAGDP